MLCYKDRTFCRFYIDCKYGKQCERALTIDIKTAARKWWGKDNAPISQFLDRPDCWKENK